MQDRDAPDVDRGWFASGLAGRRSAEPSIIPAEPGPGVSGDAWDRVSETLHTFEREISASVDPRRRAVLCHEVGRIYERDLHDDKAAVVFYQRAFRCDPTHLPTLQAGRRVFTRARKWGMVLGLLDAEVRVTVNPSKRARLLRDKGELYLTRFSQPAAARAAFVAALELVPGDPVAARGLAVSTALDGDRYGFSQVAARAADTCADSGIARSLRLHAAAAALADDAQDAACALLERVLDAAPEDAEALGMLSRAHRAAGRWREHVEIGRRVAAAVDRPARRARELAHLARVAQEQVGDDVLAAELLDAAVEADPAVPTALEQLVAIHSRAERWGEAADSLAALVEATDDPVSRVRRLWQLSELQIERLADLSGAADSLKRLLAIEPRWLPALELLGRLLAQTGDWLGLVAMHEGELEAIEEPRHSANQFFRIGEIHELRRRDWRAAAVAYREALRHDPEFRYASNALARMLARLGEWAQYVELLERQADLLPGAAEQIDLFRRIAEALTTELDEPDRAITTWRKVLDLVPEHLDATRNIARLAARTGRWDLHVEMNELEMELVSEHSTVLTLLVRSGEVCDRELGQYERAHAFLDRALALDPRFLPALQAMGRLCQRHGRWDELVAMYRRELELGARGADAVTLQFKIGEILRDLSSDGDGAARAFEAALEVQADHLPSLRALQRLSAARGDTAREAELLAAEVDHLRDPRERAAQLFRLGSTHANRLGQQELAAEAWRRALVIDPDFRHALNALLEIYELNGDFHALATTQRQIAEAADDPEDAIAAWLEVARIYLDNLQSPIEAVDAFEQVRALRPNHVGALLALERLYLQTGEATELVLVYGALVDAAEPASVKADLLLQRARVRELALDDRDGALNDYRAALDLDPLRPEALAWIEAYANDEGDADMLADVLERRLQVADDPRDRCVLLLQAGELLRGRGELEQAASCFEGAIEIEPDSPVALRALRQIYADLGRADAALRLAELEGHATQDPEQAAQLLLEAGRSREAEHLTGREALDDYVAALERNPASPEALEAVRRVCERTGRWSDLADAIERLTRTRPEPQLMVELGHLYARRLDRVEDAVVALSHAADASPGVEVLQSLADLQATLERWTDAIETYDRLRDASRDPDMRRAVAFRQATIHAGKLDDLDGARAALEAALQDDREDFELLRRVSELAQQQEDTRAESVYLRRAIEAADVPLRAVSLQMRLAQLLADSGRVEPALEQLENAAQHAPDDVAVLEALGELCGQARRPARMRAVFYKLIDLCPEDAGRLRRRLVDLSAEAGGEHGALVEELADAVAAAPGDPELRRLYAERLRRSPEGFEAAVAQYRWLVAKDPFDVEQLRVLRRLSQKVGQLDRAYELARVLNCLQAADPDDAGAIEFWRDHVRRWPERPVSDEDRALLRVRREPARLAQVLAVIRSALPEVLVAHDVARVPAPPHVVERAAKVAELLGRDAPKLELTPGPLAEVVVCGDAVVVSEALVDLPAGEQCFQLATTIELVHGGVDAVTRWSPAALRGLLEALTAAGGRTVTPVVLKGDTLEARAAALQPRVRGRQSKELDAALDALEVLLPTLDAGAARAAYLSGAHRTALLVCGGVVSALGALRKSAVETRGGNVAFEDTPGAAGIVRFVAGDVYFTLRRRLNLADA